MGRLVITFLSTSFLWLFPLSLYAEEMQKATVNGVPMRIYGAASQGYVVVAGDRVVAKDEATDKMAFDGIFEGDGHTYVLLSKYSGGASCCYSYNIIDMSGHNPITSKEFDYGFKMIKIEVDKGALHVATISHDQKHRVTYVFKDGSFNEDISDNNIQLTGPDHVPGGDIAAFANNKQLSTLFGIRATALPLSKLLGTYYEEARGIANADFGSPFIAIGGYEIAAYMQPHDAMHKIQVLLDHNGGMFAKLVLDDAQGTSLYFGNPTREERRILDH